MTDIISDFLERAEKAKGDPEVQAALVAEYALAFRPEPERAALHAAMNAAALLHWFDANLLKQVLEISTEEAEERLEALKSLSLVEQYRRGNGELYNVQGPRRLGWRRQMARENPHGFRDLSIRAADCFAKDPTHVGRIEHVYHLFCGDPDRGAIALEGLLTLAEEKSGPMSSSVPPRDVPKKFLVAFSFAGEERKLVHSIAEAVEKQLGPSKVFFDEWYEDYIAGDDADTFLQDIYLKRCALAVVCVSKSFGKKPWTLAERAAIKERVFLSRKGGGDKVRMGVLPIRVGDGNVKGISFSTTIAPDVREKTLEDAVQLILNRLWRAQNQETREVAPRGSRISQKIGSRADRLPG